MFGFIVAVLDVVALAIIGVPLFLTWGVLAFVTNYIPNIGAIDAFESRLTGSEPNPLLAK